MKFDKKFLRDLVPIIAFTLFWYIVVWPAFVRWQAKGKKPSPPVVEAGENPEEGPSPAEDPAPPGPRPRKAKEPEDAWRFRAETEDLRIDFCSVGGAVERGWLKQYHLRPGEEAPLPVFDILSREEVGPARAFVLRNFRLADLERTSWSHRPLREVDGGKLVEFATSAGGVEIRKRFFLPRKGFAFDVELAFRNGAEAPVSDLSFDLWGPAGIVPDDTPELPSRFLILQAILLARDSPEAKARKSKYTAAKVLKYFSGAVKDKVKAREGELQRELSEKEKNALAEEVRAEGFCFVSKEVVEWAAVRNRYFGCFLLPDRNAGVIKALADYVEPNAVDKESSPQLARGNVTCGVRVAEFDLGPGEEKHFRFRVYAGPLNESILAGYTRGEDGHDRSLRSAVVYGWSTFDWLSRLLLYVLRFFHFFTDLLPTRIGGYGLAIILLTALVRGGMHPLQKRMFVVQQKQAALAPEIKRIRAKYEKSDAPEAQRKMNAEIFGLYKREGANPLSGCWVMLMQMPVFIALFGALRGAFELRQAPYLWINDLSLPDHFLGITLPLPQVWPLGGPKPLNILPFLYVGIFFLQQRLTPKPADPQQQQQRTMMYIMPVFFFFIFYSMPAGLVLYFVCSSLVGMLEQWYVRKAASPGGPAPPEEAPEAVRTAWDTEAKHQKKETARAKKRRERKKNKLFPT